MSLFKKKTLVRMAKFSVSSFAAEMVECGIFFLIMYFYAGALGGAAEFVSSLIGRIFANIVGFILNRKLVFKSHGGMKKQIIRYFTYSAIQLACSVLLIMLITDLFGIEKAIGASIVKYAVDLCLFFAGYWVQKHWVFKKPHESEADSSKPAREPEKQ